MCVILARKEEFTNNVLAGFKDDLTMGGLRCTFNVLLDKCIDALSAVLAVSDLH